MKKLLALTLVICMSFSCIVLGESAAETWSGTSTGFGGTVTVTITVENGVITGALAEGPNETESVGGAALGKIGEQIVTAQSADIDGVSGATVTSTAAKEAAQAAINAMNGMGASTVSYIPGTYTGTANGMWHPVTVSVTVNESAIETVDVVECTDTSIIMEAAVNEVPRRIVEKQSLAVDAASGATVTSNGIIAAVKDALTKATDDIAALTVPLPEPEKTAAADESYDIVIVGAGGAGLSAAAQATRTSDCSVLVLEKESWIGGSTALSGSGIAVIGTDKNAGEGLYWIGSSDGKPYDATPEEIVEYYRHKTESLTLNTEGMDINYDLVYSLFDGSSEYYTYLESEGIQQITGVVPAVFDEANHRGIMGAVGLSAQDIWSVWFVELAKKNGAEIRTNSKVIELKGEGNSVTGVVVETPDSIYNVHAKKVILATGGYSQNRELVTQTMTMFKNIESMDTFCAPGSEGDAIEMLKKYDAAMTGYGLIPQYGVENPNFFDTELGSQINSLYLYTDENGDRFCDELDWYYDKVDIMLNMDTDQFYCIATEPATLATGSLTFEEWGDTLVEKGWAFKGDNVQDLAEKAGMDPDKLKASVDFYNKRTAEKPYDTYFLPINSIDPDTTMYAVRMRMCLLETMYGPKLDNNMHILTNGGEPIENLFGAGCLCLGNYMLQKYYATTNAIAIAVYGGADAADQAVIEINAK